MILRVFLNNFTSHKNTVLELGPGLHVFVGRNGSGKTSVIDGITYALFGKHGRGSNANIARDGASRGYVEVEFVLNGRTYTVGRSFDGQGRLEGAYLRVDGKPLVIGEKKKEDTVAKKIEEILCMGYEKLRASVIIQQGEIDRILSWQPREIKALFDDLLGLSVMESAYRKMNDVIKDFDERIRKETGYSVNDVDRVSKEISEHELALSKLNEELKEKERQLLELKEKHDVIKAELEKMERFREAYYAALYQIISIKDIIRSWVRKEKEELRKCELALELMKIKDDVERRTRLKNELKEEITKLEKDIEYLKKEIVHVEEEKAELKRKLEALGEEGFRGRAFSEIIREVSSKTAELVDMAVELGKSLATGDGRENSLKKDVEIKKGEILGLFEESYRSGIRTYLEDLMAKMKSLDNEANILSSRLELSKKKLDSMVEELAQISKLNGKDVERLQEEVKRGQVILEAAGIDSPEKFNIRKEKLENVEKALALIPEDGLPEPDLFYSIAVTDDVVQRIKKVEAMMPEAKAFDKIQYENLKGAYEELQKNIGALEGEVERYRKDIKEKEDMLSRLKNTLSTLENAKKFRDFLDEIRDKVYHRDGPVLKSLRSWAIKEVSRFATEHLELFNINVNGVKFEEVENELEIKCYQRGREVDTDRLSGGEKVAVALALRLAIGDILGAKRLGFFVLDEPTVHLDSENRTKLAEVFSALSRGVRQVIVITHDEEVFEEADAVLYRFEREAGVEDYTKVELIGKLAKVL
ncbi:MAG: SMC family ATPase [Nitrososphaerota archaeon]